MVQRRREIGIRIALGARSRDVMREVLRDGLMLTASGLALGLLTTGIITRLMTSQLYEVSPLDPLSLVVACATMVGIAVAAGLVPASRATRVHPISVLRDDG